MNVAFEDDFIPLFSFSNFSQPGSFLIAFFLGLKFFIDNFRVSANIFDRFRKCQFFGFQQPS